MQLLREAFVLCCRRVLKSVEHWREHWEIWAWRVVVVVVVGDEAFVESGV